MISKGIVKLTMISIVTVTYNSEKTIGRTLESILRQNADRVEHVVVDGKSSDHTLEIVESYRTRYESKGYLLKVISEKDKGPYDGMNKGVKAATGEYIGILNSDDNYDDNALAIVEKAIADTGADIYMGAIRIHNGEFQIIEKHARNTHYQTSRHFNHPAMFASKNCYEAVGEYKLGNVHADYGWFLKALKMGKKVEIIPEILADFYIGGWSSKKSLKNTMERIGTKYQVYKENGYSRLYYFECFAQEMGKYLLIRK